MSNNVVPILLVIVILLLLSGFGLWVYVLYIIIGLVVLTIVRYSYSGIRWLWYAMIRSFMQSTDPKIAPNRQKISFLVAILIVAAFLLAVSWILNVVTHV